MQSDSRSAPWRSRRLAREAKTVEVMIRIYCRGQHGTCGVLCGECAGLLAYTGERLEGCRFGIDKPTCAGCLVHCYKPAMRERIRGVMRYAGPRMAYHHPILTLFHFWDGRKKPPAGRIDMNEARSNSDCHPQWSALRECWADLKNPELRAYDDTAFAKGLRERHSVALQALVGGDELDAAVAEEITAAFSQAVAHIQGQMAMCYIAIPMEYFPRGDLIRQAAMLEEMAAKSEVDPATVAQAQAALERDVAWLAQFQAGETPGVLGQIPVSATSLGAAKVLTELLSGQ
jgi:hypothetical protein